LENHVCLSRGVHVAGAAWRAATRTVAGVGDLVQRRRALSVHHGLEQWSGGGLTSAHARGRSGEWELTTSWGKGRGAPGGPHRGYKKGDTVAE
jgi:hypothetical protein